MQRYILCKETKPIWYSNLYLLFIFDKGMINLYLLFQIIIKIFKKRRDGLQKTFRTNFGSCGWCCSL